MAKKSNKTEIKLTIISKHECLSLSGKSNLRYQIGRDADGNIYLQVISNSGGGFFNSDPVAMSAVSEMLSKLSATTPISSLYFGSLFRGASSNTSGFILAALRDQGIVVKAEGKARAHYIADDYREKIEAMGSSSKPTSAAKKPARKTTAKKSAAKTTNKTNARGRKPRQLLNAAE